MTMAIVSFLLCLLLLSQAVAFSPSTFQAARVLPGGITYPAGQRQAPLFLADNQAESSNKSEEAAVEVSTPGQDGGTYYDDEVEPAPKVGISDSMRDRLIREASTGLDSEKKQTNVILYIILGVAVLVVAGGAGIFY